MPEKNLWKKDKSIYTKKIYEENINKLEQKRYEIEPATEEEKINFEKMYLMTGIEFIKKIVDKEFKKRIERSKKSEIKRLGDLNNLWEAANTRLNIAVNLCENKDELKEASNRICEIASSLPCKDIRTYNMQPEWQKPIMGINLAIQNYELLIDDFLNKLGSNGLLKISKQREIEMDYSNREELDSKLEDAVLKADISSILKSLKEGAYVDLKLESDDFNFNFKPCTLFNYMLMSNNDSAAIDILKYGANVNIKSINSEGNVFIPILYALEKDNVKLVISMLNNGAILSEDFIGKDIKTLFREVLGIDRSLSNLKKLDKNVLEDIYINGFITLDEMKEVSKKDEKKILIEALEKNNDILISKLLSGGVEYYKDSELSYKIENYFRLYIDKDELLYLFKPCQFSHIFSEIPKEEIITRMYISDLISVDKIISIYKRNRDYVLNKLLQLGGELLFINFLNKLINNNIDKDRAKESLETYLRKTKDEDSIVGMYINGLISIDTMSDVLGKDINYFVNSAINKGNDMLIIKLLNSGANLYRSDNNMVYKVKDMIDMVKNYLENDKKKEALEQNRDMKDIVNNYERLLRKENNKNLEKENMDYDEINSKIKLPRLP